MREAGWQVRVHVHRVRKTNCLKDTFEVRFDGHSRIDGS